MKTDHVLLWGMGILASGIGMGMKKEVKPVKSVTPLDSCEEDQYALSFKMKSIFDETFADSEYWQRKQQGV